MGHQQCYALPAGSYSIMCPSDDTRQGTMGCTLRHRHRMAAYQTHGGHITYLRSTPHLEHNHSVLSFKQSTTQRGSTLLNWSLQSASAMWLQDQVSSQLY